MSIKRNYGLDIVRIMAIYFVIMAHVFTDAYNLSNVGIHNLSIGTLWPGYSGFTIGRIGVPLFLMLTGYFLLSREWTGSKVNHFWRNNFLKLLITWEVWILMYFMYNKYYIGLTKMGGGTYLKQALFLKSVQMPNAWYMPMILGIYLFIPYVSIALNKMSTKNLIVLTTVLYVYLFMVPTTSQILTSLNKLPIINQLQLSYGGGYCAFYILVGYMVKRFTPQIKVHETVLKWTLVIISLILFVITDAFQLWTYQIGKNYNVWYDFMTLPVIALTIFIIFKDLKISGRKNWLVKISDCSFGIFLIHYPILAVITKQWISYQHNFTCLVLLSLMVYVLSLLIVLIINQNKKLGTLLFFK